MKPPVLLTVLIAVPLATSAAPGSLAAQQSASSAAAAPAAEGISVRLKLAATWGQITADDITKTRAHTAHDVLSELRAPWLRPRGASSLGVQVGITVYRDGIRLGGIEELRHILASEITMIQYLNAGDATVRFGRGNSGGAILVTTRR